jgi:hypothetical protein
VQLHQESTVTNNGDGVVFTIFGRRGKAEGERGEGDRRSDAEKERKMNLRWERDAYCQVGPGRNFGFRLPSGGWKREGRAGMDSVFPSLLLP